MLFPIGAAAILLRAWGASVVVSAVLNAWPAYTTVSRAAAADAEHLIDCGKKLLSGIRHVQSCEEAKAHLDDWLVQRWWGEFTGRVSWCGPMGCGLAEAAMASWYAPLFTTCLLMIFGVWAAEVWHVRTH